jgi:hypothetical protein
VLNCRSGLAFSNLEEPDQSNLASFLRKRNPDLCEDPMDSRFRGNDARRNCALSSVTLDWTLVFRAVRHGGELIENYRIHYSCKHLTDLGSRYSRRDFVAVSDRFVEVSPARTPADARAAMMAFEWRSGYLRAAPTFSLLSGGSQNQTKASSMEAPAGSSLASG